MHLHRSHSRVQSLDLMDDIPLPFQTDSHHLNLLAQESPMLSPNPPPSVVENNGQNIPASGQASTGTAPLIPNLTRNNSSNFNSNTTSNTTNVIINNIKSNTTSIGTTNLDSGVVQPTELGNDDEVGKEKLEGKDSTVRNRWHTCPELHKAMDGVTYIADYTKKEEESMRVSLLNFEFYHTLEFMMSLRFFKNQSRTEMWSCCAILDFLMFDA